ncbi:metal-dependent hydrolase [Caldalkalibacillus salinus]|uniref:metal-dependent hydrolase n=1 Tax=Caldalkalibacillus salinus TaxID=2803787 RepID=UPI0019212E7E|nr:metal-dependent hydrolase [Caldalkalibacillus salinus]
MNAPTHIVGGVAAAALTVYLDPIQVYEPLYLYSAAIVGSLLPDICHPRSMVGRKIPVVSKGVNKFFGHRTITHSLLFILFIYWGMGHLDFRGAYDLQMGLVAGVISHIVLDMITPQGVQFLYPIKSKIKTPLHVKTGSIIGETCVIFVLLVIVAYFNMA